MGEGYLWNRKEVAISIAHIDRTDSYRVDLKLDKPRLKALPTTLSRR